MCGIAGFVNVSHKRKFGEDELLAMLRQLEHRGPDDWGYFCERSAGLGNRRLKVIDPAAESTLHYNERGDVRLSFNGEIYNHRRLREELRAAGHRFSGETDSEVVVHLYEEMGPACLDKLQGMFALAIWDASMKSLFLARDRLGIKGLYYYYQDGLFLFASELKSLLRVPGLPLQLRTASLPYLFSLQYIPSPHTPMRQVRKLPPGHYLLLQQGKMRLERYWQVPKNTASLAEEFSLEGAAERTRGLLSRAVRDRLMSDVPLGAFLSGGLDSSLVVALMSQMVPGRIKSFAVGFQRGGRYNEFKQARRVAELFDCDHRELVINPAGLPDVIPRMVYYLDEPCADPAALPTFLLSLFARRQVTVALTGEGADELFAGYRRYRYDLLAPAYQRLPAWLRQWFKGLLSGGRRRRWQQAVGALELGYGPERYLAWAKMLSRETLEQLFTDPRLMETDDVADWFRPFFENHSPDPSGSPGLNEAEAAETFTQQSLRADLCSWLPDDLLLKVDRMSMAASLEARVPYLDHRLVQEVAAWPAHLKVNRRQGKLVLRKAAEPLLPRWVIERPKHGLDVPLAAWLRKELKPMMLDLLSSQGLKDVGIFDARFTSAMVDDHLAGRADHSLPIWGLMVFELWRREFL